ncbi:MAG: DUF2231 domain-containing protein [Acidimicrobiia bacterium]
MNGHTTATPVARQEIRAPEWLRDWVRRLESDQRLDKAATVLQPVATSVGAGRRGLVLQGRAIGHALHPLMTDLPLGCWMSAGLLDLFGGKQSRTAARRLVGFGLLAVPGTVATGMADYADIADQPDRRVAVVHAAGNAAVAALYFASWRARRRGRFGSGKALGLAGGLLAMGTGYLGGHLSFARSVGTGARGLESGVAGD